jgi:hypothetical protein
LSWLPWTSSRRLRNGTSEKLTSIHIGSDGQAKGLCRMALVLCFDALSQAWPGPYPDKGDSRDFAAVMAQTGPGATF